MKNGNRDTKSNATRITGNYLIRSSGGERDIMATVDIRVTSIISGIR